MKATAEKKQGGEVVELAPVRRTRKLMLKVLVKRFGTAFVTVVDESSGELLIKHRQDSVTTYTNVVHRAQKHLFEVKNGKFRNRIDVDESSTKDVKRKIKWISYLVKAFTKYRLDVAKARLSKEQDSKKED